MSQGVHVEMSMESFNHFTVEGRSPIHARKTIHIYLKHHILPHPEVFFVEQAYQSF